MAGRRPYVDSTTGIRYDTSNPDFQGCGSPRHGTHRGALDLTARAGTAPVPLSLSFQLAHEAERVVEGLEATLLHSEGQQTVFRQGAHAPPRRARRRASVSLLKPPRAHSPVATTHTQSENSTPHGMIDLASCMTVKSAEYKAHKRNALEVSTPDTTFLMFADTEKEKDDWYAARARARRAAC